MGWLFFGRDRSGCGLIVMSLMVTLMSGSYALVSAFDGKWGAVAIFGAIAIGGIGLARWSSS